MGSSLCSFCKALLVDEVDSDRALHLVVTALCLANWSRDFSWSTSLVGHLLFRGVVRPKLVIAYCLLVALWYFPKNSGSVIQYSLLENQLKWLFLCLDLIESGVLYRYYRLFERTQDGLGKNATVESIHGSLLAVGELLRCLFWPGMEVSSKLSSHCSQWSRNLIHFLPSDIFY
jgi:hypothetical protein